MLLEGPVGAAAAQALDQRLAREAAAPLVVAISGGGDSLALLLIAKAWADVAGRRLVAVTVDHRLQPQSAAWARWCAERARRLGVRHITLVWQGDKPATGLAAAARAARHRLIAEAARAEGASVILMGHTADDLIEAAAMRAAGSTTPSPAVWSPSPAWPEGRGLFVLRPLLTVRRAALRDWLAERGETWIDDPANDDPRFARARARRTAGATGAPVCAARAPLAGADGVTADMANLITPRGAFRHPHARRLLSLLLVCASGAAARPRGARLTRLLDELAGEGPVIATLAGARVEADAGAVRLTREAGEFRRRPLAETRLFPGQPIVWDGRFLITTACDGVVLRPLAGLAARLPRAEARALRAVHPSSRPSLPALVGPGGEVTCPVLAPNANAEARPVILERFWAAAGLIEDEAAIWRVAKQRATS